MENERPACLKGSAIETNPDNNSVTIHLHNSDQLERVYGWLISERFKVTKNIEEGQENEPRHN